jgi:hypothetical protein
MLRRDAAEFKRLYLLPNLLLNSRCVGGACVCVCAVAAPQHTLRLSASSHTRMHGRRGGGRGALQPNVIRLQLPTLRV